MSALRVGWIGTGVMGAPMCGHLLAAGYRATIFNRTQHKAELLLKSGATWAESPAAVASDSDVVFTIVGFPHDVRETYFGKKGIFAAARKGQILVDMTTTPPALALEIAAQGAKEGICALDAPVSGGQLGAQAAKLTIFVGGERPAYERVLPLFEKMGKTVTYLGKPGQGQHTKMVNQILIAGQMLGLAEALSYADNCGVNPLTALEAVAAGAAGSWSVQHLGPRILKGDFAAGFFVDHFVKDLGIALQEAKRMKVPLPMVALAEQLYVALQAQGHGRLGTQALIKAYEAIRG